MAALSLSAHDIEERLQAIERRLRMRTRLHGLGYALGMMLFFNALALCFGGQWPVGRQLAWSAVLFVALTVAFTAVISGLRERRLDGPTVAAWVDREARLNLRLVTFVDCNGASRRSPLFPVLLLQLWRLLPRYEPTALVPWQPLKPVAAVCAGLLAFALALARLPEAPVEQQSAPRVVPEQESASADASEDGRRFASSDTGASQALASQGEGEALTQGETEESTGGSGSDAATLAGGHETNRAAVGRGHTSDGRADTEPQSRIALGGVGGHSKNRTDASGRNDSRVQTRSSSERGTRAEASEPRDNRASGSLSEPLARSAETAAERREGNPLEEKDQPYPSGDSSTARGGNQGMAGTGADGTGLYGEPGAASDGAATRPTEALVVELPISSVWRGRGERQGRSTEMGEARDGTMVRSTGLRPSAPLLEKPLLPPEYEALARRLFSRASQP